MISEIHALSCIILSHTVRQQHSTTSNIKSISISVTLLLIYHWRLYYHLQQAAQLDILCGCIRTSQILQTLFHLRHTWYHSSHTTISIIQRATQLSISIPLWPRKLIQRPFRTYRIPLALYVSDDTCLGFTIPHYLIHQRSHPGDCYYRRILLPGIIRDATIRVFHYATNKARQITN